ncbi:Aerotolerance protein BatB / Aerotolerance protein BatC [hydrothermal vent metagenome]|uniref:Aerotolerance protein BatB / Aerotolerance protein BatC n=1 Tax=hydrothermal vent metagenome TaxID=652676 RepID=A0A3B0ZP99_9ZZZZ
MPEYFHFLQPLWLFSLIPLAWLVWRLRQTSGGNNPWVHIIDARLRPLLLTGQDHKVSHALLWLLGLGWLLTALALANPVWEKQPQPLYQTRAAQVIVLDLSRSMLDQDLKPSRLARARFKIEDILARNDEGQTGLVVFAGDAFAVTPLTRDVDTIRALLKSLDPDLMPVQGSRADLGLEKAGELLRQAGLSNGRILLFADGVTGNKASKAATQLRQLGYRVSVLGVGTEKAEPLTNAQGQLLHTADDKIIVPQLETAALQAVAEAGGGHYRTFNSSDTDIKALLNKRVPLSSESLVNNQMQGQDWQDRGPWLAVLLLPLAALAFRRGWLLSLVLLVGVVSSPQQAMAADWEDLWQRPDQQAVKALSEKDYERASQVAEDPLLRGSAEYRRGNYSQALEDFSKADDVTADYNRGNVLAKLGRYQDAISAYDSALKSAPDMEDAVANKAAVEAFLRQQQQQQQKKDQPQNKQDKQNQKDKPGQQDKQAQKDKQNQQGKQAQKDKQDQPSKQNQQSEQAQKDKQGRQNKQAQQGKPNQKSKAQQDTSENQFADAAKALEKKTAEKKPTAKKQAEQQENKNHGENSDKAQAKQEQPQTDGQSARAESLSSEEQMAAEQWLRRIPDDPGGLLRRKFLYQYQQRAQREGTGSRQPW